MIPAPLQRFDASPSSWDIPARPRSMPPPAPPPATRSAAEELRLRRFRAELDAFVMEPDAQGRFHPVYIDPLEHERLRARERQRIRHRPTYSRTARMAEFRQTHRDLMVLLQGQSIGSVARACGMHRRQAWLILLGAWDPGAMKVRTLAKLARGMRVKLDELLRYLTEAHTRWERGDEPRRKTSTRAGRARKAKPPASRGTPGVRVPPTQETSR